MPRLHDVPLSVLDLAPVSAGSDVRTALRNTRELAQHVERLGYQRFWVAEHHNMPGIASTTPAVLINHIAEATTTLRVGSGGVQLTTHPPLVVAEQFGMLAALHPDRIDLGLLRAPGTDPLTAGALRRSSSGIAGETFEQDIDELIGYFAQPDTGVVAVPAAGGRPPLWMLGASAHTAQLAGRLGLPYAFAHHFNGQGILPALELYRSAFRPSSELDRPYVMVCASVVCADTDEDARWIAGPGGLTFLRARRGESSPVCTPAEAAEHRNSSADQAMLDLQVIGSPATVHSGLDELLAVSGADELMAVTITHDHADRLRSYALLAELASSRYAA